MDNFANIYDRALLDLSLWFDIKLNSSSMNISQVSHVILSINYNDQELGIHKFLVVWDLIMVWLAFSNFEHCSVAGESEFNVLKLFSVSANELHSQRLIWDGCTLDDHWLSIQNTGLVVDKVFVLNKFDVFQSIVDVSREKLSAWSFLILVLVDQRLFISKRGSFEFTLVHLHLTLKNIISSLFHSSIWDFRNNVCDHSGVFFQRYDKLRVHHDLFKIGSFFFPKVFKSSNLNKLSNSFKKVICTTSKLILEVWKPEDNWHFLLFK